MVARWVGSVLVSTVIAAGVVQEAAAQMTATLEPMAGLNLARVEGEGTDDLSSRTGWLAGVALGLNLSPRFTIQPGVVYTFKGAKENDSQGVEQGTFTFKYIQIPVLAQIRFPGTSNFTPFITLGPALGIEAGCTLKEVDGESSDCADEPDFPGLKSTDLTVIGGAGVDFGSVTLALRYDYGISGILDESDEDKAYNRVLSVVAGFKIRLSR